MNNSIPVITVDGPSGVGKGTISQGLAYELSWHYLDSGALYRIAALAATKSSIDLSTPAPIVELIEKVEIAFKGGAYLNGFCVEDEIRTEEAGERASVVAKLPAVRKAMLELQRRFLASPGLVADGRDMGTTIFPQAAHKFYLTADPEERAKRRAIQLKAAGLDGNIGALFRDIKQRDERDMNRADSPLIPADDAIIIDTTNFGIDEVMEKVMSFLPYRKKV